MIKVNGKEIKFVEGMTVLEAIKAAGEVVDVTTLVVADERVLSHDQIHNEQISDGVEIKLLSLLSGG